MGELDLGGKAHAAENPTPGFKAAAVVLQLELLVPATQ